MMRRGDKRVVGFWLCLDYDCWTAFSRRCVGISSSRVMAYARSYLV